MYHFVRTDIKPLAGQGIDVVNLAGVFFCKSVFPSDQILPSGKSKKGWFNSHYGFP